MAIKLLLICWFGLGDISETRKWVTSTPREKLILKVTCMSITDDKCTPLGTNISHPNSLLKMSFLFPRWDMLIPWRVYKCTYSKFFNVLCIDGTGYNLS